MLTKPTIVIETPVSLIFEKPIQTAIIDVAAKLGLTVERRPNEWWDNPPKSDKPEICIWNIDSPNISAPRHARYKKSNPNAKLITIGSDTIYYQNLHAMGWEYIDVHLDLMKGAIERISHHTKTTRLKQFFWSVSERSINEAKVFYKERLPVVNCLGLYRENSYRRRMFNDLQRAGFSTLMNPNEYNWENVLNLFNQSEFAIGTSSGVIVDSYDCPRSMKGFRDWLAPFLGCLLVYDSFNECVSAWPREVPYYIYGNSSSLIKLLRTLQDNPSIKTHYIHEQQEWASSHTCDIQFLTLFKEMGLC